MTDLHMHSTASDGTDTPTQIIEKCAKIKLQLASITDHDTIDSQREAIAVARKKNQPYITGVEFSVKHEGELHILGYGVDVSLLPLQNMMEELKVSRVHRVHAILDELKKHHISVSFEDVAAHAEGNTLGRPHVALALIEKGYASDLQDAFAKFLNENGICYVQRRKLSPQMAIDAILSAGGLPVLAHPKFIKTTDIEAQIKEMKEMGLWGVEAYYPAHTDAEVCKYVKIAKENGLYVTQGSDYHGKMRTHSAIASERRDGEYLQESLQLLKNKAAVGLNV